MIDKLDIDVGKKIIDQRQVSLCFKYTTIHMACIYIRIGLN